MKFLARSLKKMAGELSDELGLPISKEMLRRFLKRLGYSWKRFRKSLKKMQDEEEYASKVEELKSLLQLHRSGYIDLFFADESGFSREGYVPYGWQPKGEYIHITPSKGKTIQVFGLMSLDNRLEAYSCEGSMDSDAVIAFVDDFCLSRCRRTAIVIDNAPIHTSKKFKGKIKEWEEQELYVFFLPKYSPHLNPIEILWRKIKYEWLQYEFIESDKQLVEELETILCGFGEEFTIDFKENHKKLSNIFL